MNAKYSPIGPIDVLEALQREGLLGDYLLLLAHDVLKHPRRYQNLVAQIQSRSTFVMMDNSLIELGKAMDFAQVRAAADYVFAQVVVAPDTLQDSNETVSLVNRAISHYSSRDRFRLMLVPQGKTQTEVDNTVERLTKIVHHAGIDVFWGVPRIITNTLGTRLDTINTITQASGEKIHLLGMSKDFGDDVHCLQHPSVMGIDSANPLVMGMHNKILGQHEYAHLDRGGYWDLKELNDHMRENVTTMHKLARG